MANDSKGSSNWFSEQLSDLKQDLGALEDRLRERPSNGTSDGNGSTATPASRPAT